MDAMKYVLAYLLGGIVMDMDILCIQNMEHLVRTHNVLLVEQAPNQIAADFVYSSQPFHPFFRFLIDRLIQQKVPKMDTCPLDVAGPRFLSSGYDMFNSLFPGLVSIGSYQQTHPFPWNDYTHICHSKNEDFNVSN
ncbi:hypothetical protein EBU91_05130, partial [bacterium]|nr:hypothetical protein [bacterium]